MSTTQKNRGLTKVLASTWQQKYRENDLNNTGAEVEDIIRTLNGDVIDNSQSEELLQNIVDNEGAVPETKDLGGAEKLLGVSIDDENFERNADFQAEIDTDYHPAQSEVATEVFQNPADMISRTENLRSMRDRNLPESMESFENAVMQEFAMEGEADRNRRPKPRYTGLRGLHGEIFDAMGWPAATQLNTGTPVGDNKGMEEFFHDFFNGGEKPSMLDAVPAVDSLFANDPVFEEEDGVYEAVMEGGRDMIYELFVSGSPAVLRNGVERFGDIRDEALPGNDNYGNISDLSEIEDHEDYIDMVMERPMILSPEIDSSDIEVLDEDTRQPVGSFEEVYGEDSTWVMPGLTDVEESVLTFEEFLENQQYLGEVQVEENGEEVMKPVKVDHSSLNRDEFMNLAGLGAEDDTGYFTLHNTFVRPDIAPKNNGVMEFRSFSNSPRSYEALVTQKSLINVYDEVQDLFHSHGLNSDNSLEFREDAKRNGLDANLPRGESVREVYRDDLVDILTDGVRQSFGGEMPYTAELLLDDVDSYDSFGGLLEAEFETLRDFSEYTSELHGEKELDPGTYSMDEFDEEYGEFVDWFTETYRDTMLGYVEDGSPAQQLEKLANEKTPTEAFESQARKG